MNFLKQRASEVDSDFPQYGLGRCSKCGCSAFKGRGNYCEDCGHSYDDHDTKWLKSVPFVGVAVVVVAPTVAERCPELLVAASAEPAVADDGGEEGRPRNFLQG
jgi:hypothetical protein